MTEQHLTPIQPNLSPQEYSTQLSDARAKAQLLAQIVEDRKLYAIIAGRKYLEVEAWQTIGVGYGITAIVEWTRPIPEGGWEARAIAQDGMGRIRAAAETECGRLGDSPWDERPNYQQRSMAQTRAVSKALRSCLSWVVVLAGYEPTPAAEMPFDRDTEPAQQALPQQVSPQGLCRVHSIPFVRRQGVSRAGKTYDFWSCPRRVGKSYCTERPANKQEPPTAATAALQEPAGPPGVATFVPLKPIENLGDFFTRAWQQFNLTKRQALDRLEVSDETQISDLNDAWATILLYQAVAADLKAVEREAPNDASG